MTYTPDPTDPTQPVESQAIITAAAEFRALKSYLQTGTFAARKNAIIGGDFDTNPWQRGTAIIYTATGGVLNVRTADKWKLVGTLATGIATTSKTADAPTPAQAGQLLNNCLDISIGTSDTMAATSNIGLEQIIEGYNWKLLAQQQMTLSFWTKHSVVGNYYVSLIGANSAIYCVSKYIQAVSNVWQKQTITFPPSPFAGAWNYTSGVGLLFNFSLGSGANYNAAVLNAWTVAPPQSSSNDQVNVFASAGNHFRITAIQFELGPYATQFEQRDVQFELELCQRYYYKTFSQTIVPVQNEGVNTGELQVPSQKAGAATNYLTLRYPTVMRAGNPDVGGYTNATISTLNPAASNTNVRDETAAADCSAVAVVQATDSGLTFSCTGNASTAVGNLLGVHITVDCDF